MGYYAIPYDLCNYISYSHILFGNPISIMKIELVILIVDYCNATGRWSLT